MKIDRITVSLKIKKIEMYISRKMEIMKLQTLKLSLVFRERRIRLMFIYKVVT